MSSSVQQNSSKPTFKKLLARPSKRDSVSKEKFDNKVGAPLPPMRFSLDSDRGEKQVKGKKEGKGSRSRTYSSRLTRFIYPAFLF